MSGTGTGVEGGGEGVWSWFMTRAKGGIGLGVIASRGRCAGAEG